MPYLTEQRKAELLHDGARMTTPGDLTFMLTMVCLDERMFYRLSDAFTKIVDDYLPPEEERRYADFAVVLGCLESTRLEYVRRMSHKGYTAMAKHVSEAIQSFTLAFYYSVVAPYEDHKIEANGDIRHYE